MKNLTITDLNFCQEATSNQESITGGFSVPQAPTISASTDVKLGTKVTFSAHINYRTGAEYTGSVGYAGGYAAGASINGQSFAFINISI